MASGVAVEGVAARMAPRPRAAQGGQGAECGQAGRGERKGKLRVQTLRYPNFSLCLFRVLCAGLACAPIAGVVCSFT